MKFADARGITRSRVPLIAMLALAGAIGLAGCEGDDGKDGAQGPTGPAGATGPVSTVPGPTGPTGTVDQIATLKAESCSVCHSDQGGLHQAVYDKAYGDESKLALTIDSVASTGAAAPYTVTLNFSIKKSGVAYIDPNIGSRTSSTLPQKTFYVVQYLPATKKFDNLVGLGAVPTLLDLDGNGTATDPCVASPTQACSTGAISNGDGTYYITVTGGINPAGATTADKRKGGFDYMPEASNAVAYGYIAQTQIQTELPLSDQIKLYDDVSNAAKVYGTMDYVSTANVEACENCHAKPYMKHGYRAAVVAGLPDFVACKTCHWDGRNGGHYAWQMFVDDPLTWATVEEADYSAAAKTKLAYKANVMNDVHMSHIMEFPYPQNGSSCVTCHEGNLNSTVTGIFADSRFTAETCTSCHAIDGKDAWKAGTYIINGVQTTLAEPQKYFEAAGDSNANSKIWYRKRAPALRELWNEVDADGPVTFHDATDDCTTCHKAGGPAGQFTAYHQGYDPQIYDATGKRYTELYSVAIDNVTKTGNVLNIQFSANNPSVKPMVAISFYGYDTKDYLVSAHTSDANGKRMEKTIGTANTLFTEIPRGTETDGLWEISIDLNSYVPTTAAPTQPGPMTATGLAKIPDLITAGKVKKMEISVLPSLTVNNVAVAIKGAAKTYTVTPTAVAEVSDYFKGKAAIADDAKCNKCHDALGTTFHNPSYGSGGVVLCRNCHVVTSGGSHLEMQSRSIDSYTHAIHAFQAFDPGDIVFADPVEAARYDMHVEHIFPLFTKLACEGCHVNDASKYDVPDQSKSMPGMLSAADVLQGRDRAIGTVPAQVTGPGARACGSCHKSMAINEDEAGDLQSVFAHTGQNGYLIDNNSPNPTTTAWVYRVIDKVMSLF